MEVNDIKSDIKNMIKEITVVNIENIKDDDLLFDDIGLESIDIVQIFVSCEDKYSIEMHDEVNMVAPLTINYIAEIVYNKINEKDDEKNENAN